MTETELLAPLIKWLKARGEDVYQEPAITLNGNPAPPDIVSVLDGVVTVWEGKRYLNEELASQCERWQGYGHTYAVVPSPKRKSKAHEEQIGWLLSYGAGLAYVVGFGESATIDIQFGPRLNPTQQDVILAQLDPNQKGCPAGSSSGKRVARDKWSKLRSYLRRNPGSMMIQIKYDLDYTKVERKEIIRLTNREELAGVTKTHRREYFLQD